MKITVGILTENNELIEDFKQNSPDVDLLIMKSIDSIKREDFHLLIVDCDFFESIELIQFFLSKIRKKIHETPAILLVRITVLNDINMDWFFDDFIVYPFRKFELFSRIKRLLRDKGIDTDIIVIGPFKMNLKEYSVYSGTEKLELTYKEFELLRILVQNRGIVFTRKDLLNKIWGIEYIGGTRTVDVHIRRLRNKLGDEFNSVIETVRNVGYRCI